MTPRPEGLQADLIRRAHKAAVATVDLGDENYLAHPKYVRVAADAALRVILEHLLDLKPVTVQALDGSFLTSIPPLYEDAITLLLEALEAQEGNDD